MRNYDNQITPILPEATTVIATFDVSNSDRLFAEIAVTENALDVFEVYIKNTNGSYLLLYSTPAQFQNREDILILSSGDLTIISANESGHIIMDIKSIDSVQFRSASSNVAGSGVTVFADAQ